MPLLEEVAGYLATQLSLTAGTNLFANSLPETTRVSLSIFEVPGNPPQQRFGNNPLPAFERPRIRIITRSTRADSGTPIPTASRDLAFRAWKALNSVTDSTLPTSTTAQRAYYQRIEPMASPSLLDRDEKGRYLFMFTCDVMRTPNSSG